MWLPGLSSSVSLLVSPSVCELLSRENVVGYEEDLQYKSPGYEIDWLVELKDIGHVALLHYIPSQNVCNLSRQPGSVLCVIRV